MAHLQGNERAKYVQTMFSRIAGRYDLMNRLMTAGQDVRWRRYVIKQANLPPNGRLLDIATGTGEIALEGLLQQPSILSIGGDFTIEMMQAGQKIASRKDIKWVTCDALALPFPPSFFDAVTSGFLMRNVIDLPQACSEQFRVLKPGGRIVILESSPPKDNLLKPFILIHLNYIIPLLGKLIASESDAYQYLPDSTQQFKTPDSLSNILEDTGFINVSYKLFMFGTVAIHVGEKPNK